MRNLLSTSLLVLLSSALPAAAQVGTTTYTATVATPGSSTYTIAIAPVVAAVDLSSTSVNTLGSTNAGTVVGAVSVMTTPGNTFTGKIRLTGTDRTKFAVTNGGKLPCNLVLGSTNLAPGTYQIGLEAQ